MVSNTLNIKLEELLASLRRIKRAHGKSAEYRSWRRDLPKDWPV